MKIEVKIPEKIGVSQDKVSKAKFIQIPIEFEDGVPGAIVLMKLQRASWNPSKEIKFITIETND